jgi:putative membrane protein
MKAKLYVIAAATILLACKKDDQPTTNANDEQFLRDASVSNYNEIDAGQLASSKAKDRSVKQFGALMVTEHQDAQNELKSLAANKKITIAEAPDQSHAAQKQQLLQMDTAAFDSAYIHAQVTDHQAAVKLFSNEISNGKDQQVKDYANKYLPHIQMHFSRADSTSKRF